MLKSLLRHPQMIDEEETVARMLEELADLEEIRGTDYKPTAYRRAARNLREHETPLSVLNAEDRIGDIEGVGEAIQEKIAQALETGSIDALDTIREEVPVDVVMLGQIRGLGPRKITKLYEELGVETLDDLAQAVETERLQSVSGFGPKTQEKIASEIERVHRASGRWLYAGVLDTASQIRERLADERVFQRVDLAGALRRRTPLVEGITFVATAEETQAALETFAAIEPTASLESKSARRATIELARGLMVELVIVDEAAFGAARIAHTGSAEHVAALREPAAERGYVLSDTGLEDDEGDPIDAPDEAAVYRALGLDAVPPELREATGEVEAASRGQLPELVELADIRGDLQMHTEYSDGAETVEEMARKADALGYDYILLTDHGPSLGVANAPSLEELAKQGEEVARVNEDDAIDATVLHGVEANIRSDGLDVPEEVCRDLDLVVASLHSMVDDANERVLQVMEDYSVDVLGHPTNRRLLERDGNDLDLEAVVATARANDVAIEINAQVNRLDLDWSHVRRFKGEIDFVVSTDAHSPRGMEQMIYGVHQARKGWLEPEDIVNTRPLEQLLARLGRG